MEWKLQHRIALIGTAGLLVAGFVYSQIYIHRKNRREIEGVAGELADVWKEELQLDDEQSILIEDTIISYTIRKNDVINSNLKMDNKIRKLKAIQNNEYKALKKFLSESQFENYISLNRQITRKS